MRGKQGGDVAQEITQRVRVLAYLASTGPEFKLLVPMQKAKDDHARTCNHSTCEAETGGLLGLVVCLSTSRFSKRRRT